MEEYLMEIKSFLDGEGRLTALPVKRKKKLIALWYLAEKIEKDRSYSEPEINDFLNTWTLFRDPATLRRELYDETLLNRTPDCRRYWKEGQTPSLKEFIETHV